MSRVDSSDFNHIVRDRGLGGDREAHRAIMAVLAAFGAHVPAPEREAVARALPLELARAVSSERYRGPGTAERLYAAVARAERTRPGFAREHVQIVIGALGELLPDETEKRVERALSPSIAELLHFASLPSETPDHAVPPSAKHHTLATGKPGSSHPVSESHPPEAQTESAGSTNPHGDVKLSSAHGETQEREEESLGTAHPRTDRTIAESHD